MRRVVRVVRDIDAWSVFKVGLVFHLVLYVVALIAVTILWSVASSTGTIENVENFFESFGWETFSFDGSALFGNFATFGRFNLKGALGVGVILEVELDASGEFLGGQVIPTMQVGDGVPMLDPERRAVTQMSSLSAEDFGARAAQVSADGVIRAP